MAEIQFIYNDILLVEEYVKPLIAISLCKNETKNMLPFILKTAAMWILLNFCKIKLFVLEAIYSRSE